MIPLGVLASAHVAPAGGSDLAWLGSAFSATNTSSYSFTSQPFGAPDADRYIIVGGYARSSSTGGVSSVTIGGVTATIVNLSNGADSSWFAYANVPTGTTGTVAITYGVSQNRQVIGIWSVPSAPTVDGSGFEVRSSDAARSVTVDSTSGGYVLATAASTDGDSGSWTYSANITTRATIDQAAGEATTATIGDGDADATSTTVTADWSVNGATGECLSVLSIHL